MGIGNLYDVNVNYGHQSRAGLLPAGEMAQSRKIGYTVTCNELFMRNHRIAQCG